MLRRSGPWNSWRTLEDDLRTLIASGFDDEVRKLLTEEAPLPPCNVSANSKIVEIARREIKGHDTSHLAKPLLTSSDGQDHFSSQKLSLGEKSANTSVPAPTGKSIDVREEPPPPQKGACYENRRPQDVTASESEDGNRPLQLGAASALLPNPFDGSEPSEPVAKFTESIRDLLRGAPKRFKELYPMIAERQPENCRADGNKVSLTSMGWLREIQRELQEIGINRDGFCCLKEEIASQAPVPRIEHSSEPAKQVPSELRSGPQGSTVREELRGMFE